MRAHRHRRPVGALLRGTVAVSLAALIALPVPFLRSVGLGGLLIPVISVAAALTLLPALLLAVGRRLDWPHRTQRRPASRLWRGSAPASSGTAGSGPSSRRSVLLALAAPVLGPAARPADQRLPGLQGRRRGDRRDAPRDAGLGGGLTRPSEVVCPTRPASTATVHCLGARRVAGSAAPTGVDGRRSLALVEVWSSADTRPATGPRPADRRPPGRRTRGRRRR